MARRGGSSLYQLTLWRVREFIREPEAVFWIFAFPVLLAFALGIAFKYRGPTPVTVAVEEGPGAATLVSTLESSQGITARVLDGPHAQNQLRTGRVSLVAVPGDPVVFRYDSTREESHLARLVVTNVLQAAGGRRDVRVIREERVTEPGSRYIDFLIPGLLGMNIMGTGMWGIGFGVVKTRSDKLLKRLLASPMTKSEYLMAHVLARLVFLALEVAAVLVFAALAFQVPVRGSLLTIGLIVVLGAMTFSGMGLLVASRSKTVEGVSGLMNLVMVPMWICSGVFFSWSHFPEAVQPFIRALPLTALNDALRATMIDGAPAIQSAGAVGVVGLWGVVSFAAALKIFRWS